jgi:uncharacterized protein
VYREIMWTEEAEDHIAGHNVTPADVESLVNSRPVYEAPGVEGVTLQYGVTDAGRYLLVVLAEAMDGRWYVVTARDMTSSEKRTFRAKGR